MVLSELDNYDEKEIEKNLAELEPSAINILPEVVIKHPLQNVWTLWYLEIERSKTWEEMQNEITSFNTVEDFWYIYNHLKLASHLKTGSDYSLFKKGIRPMWEDEGNKNGGRWVITLNRNQRIHEVDHLWLDVILCLIGESFHCSDEICGAVVNIRNKNVKISVWTRNGNNEQTILDIGHKLRFVLRLDSSLFAYTLHRDSISKQSSAVKPAYILPP